MNQEDIIYPLFTMAMLAGLVMALLFYFRLKALLEGKIEPHYLEKHGAESAPPVVVRLTHDLANLFEFPMLFMAAGLLVIVLHKVDEHYVYLAWVYVGLRYIHSVIHVTYNKVLHRASIHFISDMVLVVLWFRILLQTAGVI